MWPVRAVTAASRNESFLPAGRGSECFPYMTLLWSQPRRWLCTYKTTRRCYHFTWRWWFHPSEMGESYSHKRMLRLAAPPQETDVVYKEQEENKPRTRKGLYAVGDSAWTAEGWALCFPPTLLDCCLTLCERVLHPTRRDALLTAPPRSHLSRYTHMS